LLRGGRMSRRDKGRSRGGWLAWKRSRERIEWEKRM
jgi:hypothetical protein